MLGVLLFKVGLDDADKWASVLGVFATLFGLGISGYSAVLSRRALQSGPPVTGVQATASGTRSIAAQTISGTVSTGDTAPRGPTEKNPIGNAPQTTPAPAAEVVQVTVTASGTRSIAAQTISGTVSTGDDTTSDR
ncbi:hypothetical protein GCM10018952_02130 [Streptosporangium vulgare]